MSSNELSLWEIFVFSANCSLPICLMLMLGVLLKRIALINDAFIDVASRLVFQVTLPTLLFLSIISSEHDFAHSTKLITYGLAANIIFFILVTLATKYWLQQPNDKGVIIQGSYRANTAIIGLAYVANAYGDSGVALAAVYVAPMTILYNILAIIALSKKQEHTSSVQAIGVIIKTVTKNPLVIAIMLGLTAYFLSIPIPETVLNAGQYFANMTLPLALLCTGGSLNIHSLKSDHLTTWFAAFNKLVLAPVFVTCGALVIGFRGLELGIIFFMSGAPTAAASYIMARAMNGNTSLAANILALTTVLSLFTCTMGVFILSSFNLM